MKYSCVALLLAITSLIHAAAPAHTAFEVDIANLLAQDGIIVDQSSNPANYRLGSTMSRQEAVGVTLRMADIELPEKYYCKNYFRDVAYNPVNNWVCRAIEIGADQGIISRANAHANPLSPITRIEALAMIMQAQKITYPKNIARTGYPQEMPQWQIDLLSAALSQKIISSVDGFGPDAPATRMDVFGLIYNVRYAGKSLEYISENYGLRSPLASAPETTSPAPVKPVGPLAAFRITAPETVTAGVSFPVTITALDSQGKIITDHKGTIYIDVMEWDADDTPFSLERDNSFAFGTEGQGTRTLEAVTFKVPGTYTLDIYELESGKDIAETITLTVIEKGAENTITVSSSQKKYPSNSMLIGEIPEADQEAGVRFELVDFSGQGKANYIFGAPGHWYKVFVAGEEVKGYDNITYQDNFILLEKEGEGRVMVDWKLQPAYDQIMSSDGTFVSKSGSYWAYGAIKDGKGYIVSNKGIIELGEGWRILHLPTFDSEGNIIYVAIKYPKTIGSKLVYKDKIFEHDLISPAKIVNGKLVYTYMNKDTPDTLYLAIDGKTIAKSEGNDPNWLGYGVSLGASGFFVYDNVIFFEKKAYDLSGKIIQVDMPSTSQVSFLYPYAEEIGSIKTVEGEKKIYTLWGGTYWYSETEKRLYPASISKTGKQAYVKPIKTPLPTKGGHSISYDVESSDGILKDFSQIRQLEYIGDKLLIVGSKSLNNYVYIGEEIFGPYKGRGYEDSIILPIHIWENKVEFAYESPEGKLYWEALPIN